METRQKQEERHGDKRVDLLPLSLINPFLRDFSTKRSGEYGGVIGSCIFSCRHWFVLPQKGVSGSSPVVDPREVK